jgi:NAD(P) transhydrogenase subunit alpha
VRIHGPTNLPAEMPVHASQLYAKTISSMIQEFSEEGSFTPDFDDQIFDDACLTHDGEVRNERVREALGLGEPATEEE